MSTDSFVSLASRGLARLAADFQLVPVLSRSDESGTVAKFENATTVVMVRHDAHERRVFVSLHAKRGTDSPVSHDMEERLRDPLNGFDADDLIALRRPNQSVLQEAVDLKSGTSLRQVLEEYSDALAEVGGDVLTGDFDVFGQLAKIVHDRIRNLEKQGMPIGPDAQAFLRAYAPSGDTLDS